MLAVVAVKNVIKRLTIASVVGVERLPTAPPTATRSTSLSTGRSVFRPSKPVYKMGMFIRTISGVMRC